jgi:hypothetical protein
VIWPGELKVQPTQIHQWVQQAKLQLEQLLQRTSGGRSQAKAADSKDQEIAKLKAKLVQKHEVISKLMEENVKAKKANGDLWKVSGSPTTHATRSSIT